MSFSKYVLLFCIWCVMYCYLFFCCIFGIWIFLCRFVLGFGILFELEFFFIDKFGCLIILGFLMIGCMLNKSCWEFFLKRVEVIVCVWIWFIRFEYGVFWGVGLVEICKKSVIRVNVYVIKVLSNKGFYEKFVGGFNLWWI